jgi:HAD superfamily hydrolase (TIGR01549 family)
MPVRAYLFDYGGTLDGEGWHWFDRTVHLYRQAGCDLPIALLKRAFYAADETVGGEASERGYRLRELVERHVEIQMSVLGEGARPFAPAVAAGFRAMTEEGWARARRLFERLAGRFDLGVVSNFYGNLDVQLEEAGLARFLVTVVESVKVGLVKPDPAIYRLAAERLALPPGEIVMVGDNFARDVVPAKGIGMGAIWLRRGMADPPEPGVADRIVGTLAEIDA